MALDSESASRTCFAVQRDANLIVRVSAMELLPPRVRVRLCVMLGISSAALSCTLMGIHLRVVESFVRETDKDTRIKGIPSQRKWTRLHP